jgi:hypothetical protein
MGVKDNRLVRRPPELHEISLFDPEDVHFLRHAAVRNPQFKRLFDRAPAETKPLIPHPNKRTNTYLFIDRKTLIMMPSCPSLSLSKRRLNVADPVENPVRTVRFWK